MEEEYLQKVSVACSDGRVDAKKILQMTHKTVGEMLSDRGYQTRSLCSDVNDMLRAIMRTTPVFFGAKRGGGNVHVYYDKEVRTTVKTARSLVQETNGDSVIVVSILGPTPFCSKDVAENKRISFFQMQRLVTNVTHHRLVPSHRMIDEEEEEALLKKYSLLRSQLPVLLLEDPVCRYYDFPLNSIVEIRRAGMGYETSLYYRRVS